MREQKKLEKKFFWRRNDCQESIFNFFFIYLEMKYRAKFEYQCELTKFLYGIQIFPDFELIVAFNF